MAVSLYPALVFTAIAVALVAARPPLPWGGEERRMHPQAPLLHSRRIHLLEPPSASEKDASHWRAEAQRRLLSQLSTPDLRRPARNVIMFLGDGMSIPTLAAARTLLGQRRGKTGEESQLSFEKFPHAGLSKTYCVDTQVADSACTSTAYLTGVKANMGTMGVTAAIPRGDCQAQNNTRHHVDSIVQWAQEVGKSTGIVTTVTVTHASPGGGYAHIAERNWESDADVHESGADPDVCADMATQLVTRRPGRNLNVILGGGRQNFRPNTTVDEEGSYGRRWDGRDLVQEWERDKRRRGASSQYVWNRQQLLNIDTANTDYVLGLFKPVFMDFHLDADQTTQPRLKELTEVAIKTLEKNKKGYFLFVEGGEIDVAHHRTYTQKALDETIEFSEAIQVAADLTNEQDTLIVVTADHAHTMVFNGYPARGNDILGVAGNDTSSLPYLTLGYGNGQHPYLQLQEDGTRRDLSKDDTHDKDYHFPSMVPMYAETHGGDDVGVFSRGPWSHLLTGVFEQNYIPHVMAFASCVGDGLTACDTPYGRVPT